MSALVNESLLFGVVVVRGCDGVEVPDTPVAVRSLLTLQFTVKLLSLIMVGLVSAMVAIVTDPYQASPAT